MSDSGNESSPLSRGMPTARVLVGAANGAPPENAVAGATRITAGGWIAPVLSSQSLQREPKREQGDRECSAIADKLFILRKAGPCVS